MINLSKLRNDIYQQQHSLIHNYFSLDIISEICSKLFPSGMSNFVTVCRLWNRIGLRYVWNVKITPLRFFVNHMTCHKVMENHPNEKDELSKLVSEAETPPSSLKLIFRTTPEKVMAVSKRLVRLTSDELVNIKSAENGLVVEDKMNVLALAGTLKELDKANSMAEKDARDASLINVVLQLKRLRYFREAFDVIRSMSSDDMKLFSLCQIKDAFDTRERFIEVFQIIVKISQETKDFGFSDMRTFIVQKKAVYEALIAIGMITSEKLKSTLLQEVVDLQNKKEHCDKVLEQAKTIKDVGAQSSCLWHIGRKWSKMKFFEEAKQAAQIISDQVQKEDLENAILHGLIEARQFANAIDYLGNWSRKEKDTLLLWLLESLIENNLFKKAEEIDKSQLKIDNRMIAFRMIVESLIKKRRLDEALKVANSIPNDTARTDYVSRILELKRTNGSSFCSVM